MPTSAIAGIGCFLNYLDEVRPQSILDIGVGFGRLGFLAREYLENAVHGDYQKKNWKVKIDGIEVFPDYIQPHHHEIYNDIHFGDGFEVIDTLGQYDVVILGDVLEHFPKSKAWEMLEKCVRHCNRAVFLFLPIGPDWEQGEVYGNEHERHLSFWELEEIKPFSKQEHCVSFSPRTSYGRFLIQKEDFLHFRIREKMDDMTKNNQAAEGIRVLEMELTHLPPNLESEYFLVDHMIQQQQILPAVDRLESLIGKFPQEKETIQGYIEKLKAAI